MKKIYRLLLLLLIVYLLLRIIRPNIVEGIDSTETVEGTETETVEETVEGTETETVEETVEGEGQSGVSEVFTLDTLDDAIIAATLTGADGFTFDTFRKLSESEKKQLYTDEGIVNINGINDNVISKMEQKCSISGSTRQEDLKECIESFELKLIEAEKVGPEIVSLSDFIEWFQSHEIFYTVIEDLLTYVRGEEDYNYNDLLDELNIYVSLFENTEGYQKDYEEFSKKILNEGKRMDVVEGRHAGYDFSRQILKIVEDKNSDKIFKFYLKGMACRKNIIEKIKPQHRKIPRMVYGMDTGSEVLENKDKILNGCEGKLCVGTADITKIHICPKLKYKKILTPELQGNTDDKCCDLSFFDEVFLFFQDLF